ncbi:MAG: hypothetical protein SAK29_39155 [Scytonema sp. PMC 1069.18]|nr:hypothetical protein [Scytonema sp. PMC 1069.18]MEC4885166.1 hypothetical protein [Scytonema sp. PMC 1070.18]
MARNYQNFTIAFASATLVAIFGNISSAKAFQFFFDRTEWETVLPTQPRIFDFGEPRILSSETTVFPNGVSASAGVSRGLGTVEGTAFNFFSTQVGSVGVNLNVDLPSGVSALGFDADVGPINRNLFVQFQSEDGESLGPGVRPAPFFGIISEPDDPLITGFSVDSLSPETGFVTVRNISSSITIPESSCILGLLAVSTLGATLFESRKRDSVS